MNLVLLNHTPEAEKTIALAAKLCYAGCSIEELNKKQTKEAVDKFLKLLSDINHESPIEHVTFTFGVEGVSRALTHQLVRHRIGCSYSQQSQRYVKLDHFEYIIPPAIKEVKLAKKIFEEAMQADQEAYDKLVSILMEQYAWEYCKVNAVAIKSTDAYLNYLKNNKKDIYSSIEKRAIEDARYVFPNACETKMVFTMNARALYNFFRHRCCERAQWEIRMLADEMLELVKPIAPTLFSNCGAPCVNGPCHEGKMSCGNPKRSK